MQAEKRSQSFGSGLSHNYAAIVRQKLIHHGTVEAGRGPHGQRGSRATFFQVRRALDCRHQRLQLRDGVARARPRSIRGLKLQHRRSIGNVQCQINCFRRVVDADTEADDRGDAGCGCRQLSPDEFACIVIEQSVDRLIENAADTAA